MPRALNKALRAPITDIASAKAWLRELVAQKMSFHLEDDPDQIIEGATDEPLFFEEDVALISRAQRALYELEWGPKPGMGYHYCPIGFMMTLEKADDDIEQANGHEPRATVYTSGRGWRIIDREYCPTYQYGEPGRFHLFRGKTLVGAFDTPDLAEEALL